MAPDIFKAQGPPGGAACGAMAPPLFKVLLSDFAQKGSLEQFKKPGRTLYSVTNIKKMFWTYQIFYVRKMHFNS